MEAKLSVEIGASVSKLTKDMATASRVVSTEATKIDKSTITLQKNLNNLNKTPFTFGQNFQRQSQLASNSVNQLDNAVKKSRGNLQAWIYIIQDAPFGLMGIQNNLTQLIPGVGAATLAFSALISALTFSQVGMTYWNRGAKESKKAADELSESLEVYVSQLRSVDSALLKGQQSAQKEVVSLRSLYEATQNTNLSLSERKKAVDVLQAQYPAYFKNIKDEDILAGKAANSYQNLTNQIIAKAKAQAFADKIAENANKILELDIANKSKQEQIESRLASIREQWSKSVYPGKGNAEIDAGRAKQLDEVLKRTRQQMESELELTSSRYTRLGLLADNVRLESEITKNIQDQGVEVLGLDGKLGGVQEKYKRINTEALDINKTLEEENKLREEGLKKITAYLAKLSGADGANASAMSGRVVSVPLEFQFTPTAVTSASELLQQQFQEEFGDKFQKNINQLLNNTLGNAFGDSFSALGEALAKGGNPIESFGQSVIQGFGSFLSEFGGLLIKYGIAATAYGKLQAALLTPGGAIIAGPLAIAAGLALKIASGAISGFVSGEGSQQSGYQIPKFADGVTNFSGGLAMVGERGPELVTLPTGSNVITNENVGRLARNNGGGTQKIEVYGEISGDKINLVSSRSARKTNRIT